ncbi:hypothetical protein DSM25559_5093 [Agrobacterium rosae]|uniref:Uncharacterized protein n=1 Tax=Agrobacterium rosae TaxID=1972867 RepID=A0A1R3U2Q2_9HYPH|nr:hypothetical protein DSM25559_5093 [Agrobacterium rosae]
MRLVIAARRFYCDAVLCGRRIFTERFEADVLARGRGVLRGLIISSIISGLLWVDDRRRLSPAD